MIVKELFEAMSKEYDVNIMHGVFCLTHAKWVTLVTYDVVGEHSSGSPTVRNNNVVPFDEKKMWEHEKCVSVYGASNLHSAMKVLRFLMGGEE